MDAGGAGDMDERLTILRMVASGQVQPADAAALLAALEPTRQTASRGSADANSRGPAVREAATLAAVLHVHCEMDETEVDFSVPVDAAAEIRDMLPSELADEVPANLFRQLPRLAALAPDQREDVLRYEKDELELVVRREVDAQAQARRMGLERMGRPAPAPLERLRNNLGTSDDGDPGAADADGLGASYSAQALAQAGAIAGAVITVQQLTFRWPATPAGAVDNVVAVGQTIQVDPVPGATRLGFLGMATHGPSTGDAVVRYTDGTAQAFALTLSDWTLNGGRRRPAVGNHVALRMPYRNARSGAPDSVATMVFAAVTPLDGGRTVESVTLPAMVDAGAIHVFAVALGV